MERPSVQRLREEIKQTKPFHDLSHAASIAMVRTADEGRRVMESVIGGFGITLEQYNVLRILRGAGENGLPTLEIAARLLEKNPGITRLVDKLEAKKLLCRNRCTKDRRQVFCTITAAGIRIVNQIDEPSRRYTQYMFRGLTIEQIETLIDLLDRVRYPETENQPEGPR